MIKWYDNLAMIQEPVQLLNLDMYKFYDSFWDLSKLRHSIEDAIISTFKYR